MVRAEEGDGSRFHMLMGSDGQRGPVLACTSRTVGNFLTGTKPQLGYMTMDGQEVFKFAVKKVPEIIEQVTEEAGVSLEDVRWFILHQANYRISESIAKRLKVSMDRIPMNIESYGNTSAATVPVLLDEMNRQGKLKKRRSAGAGRLRRRPDLGSHAVYMADGIVKALPVFRRLSIYGGAQRFRNKK